MDALFGAYAAALPRVRALGGRELPARGRRAAAAARARAVGAKALDLLRGLLPAASLSHMGIYASGQSYEQLILHLIGHPLPEARRYGELLLRAVQAVMPSFVARVERPGPRRRLGRAPGAAARAPASAGRPAGPRRAPDPDDARPSVRLVHVDGDEDALLAALLFEAAATSEERTREAVAALDADERAALLADLVGERANRRHRPGRGFEALRYRFEVVSDYGAFRDLQRHRMLDRPVAGADARPRRRRARGARRRRRGRRVPRGARPLRRRVPPARRTPATPPPRPTRSASATGSATCSTSTRARRCT